MAKASDTGIICIAGSQYDVSFPRDWSTPAVTCMWPSQHLKSCNLTETFMFFTALQYITSK